MAIVSLVNDMLRDLDRRKSSDQPTLREDGSGLAVAPPDSKTILTASRLLLAAGLLILFAGGYFFYGLYSKYQQQLERQQVLNDEAQALLVPRDVESKPATLVAQEKSQEPVRIEQLAVSETEKGARIEIGLSQALQHRVLAIDEQEIAIELPGAQLTQLLPSVTDNGLISAIDVASREQGLKLNIRLAQSATFQTYLLNQEDSVRLIVDFILENTKVPGGQPAVKDTGEPVSSAVPTPPETSDQPAPDKELDKSQEPLTDDSPVSAAPKNSAPPASFSKTTAVLSVEEKDRIVAQQAAGLIREGQYDNAVKQLQGFLAETPGALKTRVLLARLYLQQGNYSAVETLLTAGLDARPGYGPFVISMARVLMEQRKNSDALALLKKHESNLKTDIGFLSLLAPLLQREASHSEAVSVFGALLRHDESNAQWWIGQAISLEALGKRQQALQAYLRARRIPQIDARLREYASNRIAQLREMR